MTVFDEFFADVDYTKGGKVGLFRKAWSLFRFEELNYLTADIFIETLKLCNLDFVRRSNEIIEFHDIVKYHYCSEDEEILDYLYGDLEDLTALVKIQTTFLESSILQTIYCEKHIGFCENSYNGIRFVPLIEQKELLSFSKQKIPGFYFGLKNIFIYTNSSTPSFPSIDGDESPISVLRFQCLRDHEPFNFI